MNIPWKPMILLSSRTPPSRECPEDPKLRLAHPGPEPRAAVLQECCKHLLQTLCPSGILLPDLSYRSVDLLIWNIYV